jgi:hypothetical protein
MRRLTAIVRIEFGVKLDWRSLDWLLGLLIRLNPGADSDALDDMMTGQAATMLEVARRRSAPYRLIDLWDLQAPEDHSPGNLAPTTCPRCGGPWDIEHRAWRRLCERCTSFGGTVLELDVAIRTEPRVPDKFGRDPLDCQFPGWKPINVYLREKHDVSMVGPEHWERFLLWFEVKRGIDRGRLLAMPLTELAATLDQDGTTETADAKMPTSTITTPDRVPKSDEPLPAPPGGLQTALSRGKPKPEHLKVLAKAHEAMLIHSEHRRKAKAIGLWALILEQLQKPESEVPFFIKEEDIIIHCHNKTRKRKAEELLRKTGAKAIKDTIQQARGLGRDYRLPYKLAQVAHQGVVVTEEPTTKTPRP